MNYSNNLKCYFFDDCNSLLTLTNIKLKDLFSFLFHVCDSNETEIIQPTDGEKFEIGELQLKDKHEAGRIGHQLGDEGQMFGGHVRSFRDGRDELVDFLVHRIHSIHKLSNVLFLACPALDTCAVCLCCLNCLIWLVYFTPQICAQYFKRAKNQIHRVTWFDRQNNCQVYTNKNFQQ